VGDKPGVWDIFLTKAVQVWGKNNNKRIRIMIIVSVWVFGVQFAHQGASECVHYCDISINTKIGYATKK
jgi:hypothetical protein